jgi:hypothetical protein
VRFHLFPSAYTSGVALPEVTTLSGLSASAFAMPAPTGYRFALAVFVAIFRSLAGRFAPGNTHGIYALRSFDPIRG